MDRRDQLHGKTIQDSGLNQHVRFPVAGLPGIQSFEPSMVMMECMAAPHDADTQNLLITNQQLLEGHHTLRQNLYNTEKEIEKIRDNLRSVEVLSGIHTSDLVGMIRKMEAEICAGAAVKRELLEVHLEADKLRAEKKELSVKLVEVRLEADKLRAEKQESSIKLVEVRLEAAKLRAEKQEISVTLLEVPFELDKLRAEKQELSVKLQEMTDRIKTIEKCCDGKACFPELHAKLDMLQEEYQSARAVLQYSRDINKKQVEEMNAMEMSLRAMTEQVNKLCVELKDTEMKEQELAMVAQPITDESGIAETQTMPAGIGGSHGSANNNFPSAYHQETQEGQFGVAQDPSASAAVYPYESPNVYSPAASYQQAIESWDSENGGYSYANYDENRIDISPVYTEGYDLDALGYPESPSPTRQDDADQDTTTSLGETMETSSDTSSLVSLTLTDLDLM